MVIIVSEYLYCSILFYFYGYLLVYTILLTYKEREKSEALQTYKERSAGKCEALQTYKERSAGKCEALHPCVWVSGDNSYRKSLMATISSSPP